MIEDRISSGDEQSLRGKELSLDFANTAEWHASEHPIEELKAYADLVNWAARSKILSEEEARKLVRRAKRESSRAEEVLKRAIELREAIYRVFSDVAGGKTPQNKDMAVINMNLSRTMAKSRLVHTKDGFVWRTNGEKGELDSMLDFVVRSAAELLTSDSLNRVKECADDRGCGYLFMDKSRNRTRRWCSMSNCGNRAKAQRFYRKQQEEQSGAS